MARPPRTTVDYFPHFIGDGRKSFFIEQKYGNDGYATWFKILETLAKTEHHYLNLNDDAEIMFLAARCMVEEEVLLNILTDLSKLGQINKELWQSRVVWSDKFIESIQDAYSKRSNNCMNLEGLRGHLLGLRVLKGDVNPQSKVKETKVNKTKVKERGIDDRKREFYNSLIPYLDEFGKDTLKEFYEYWTEHSPMQRKFRAEKEKAFDIKRRLTKWKENEERFKKGVSGNGASELVQQLSQTDEWKNL